MKKTKDIAAFLGVEAVTIRKYCGALERHGYSVYKDANGQRQYSDKDATAFQELKALCERSGMKVDTAAEIVATRYLKPSEIVAGEEIIKDESTLMRYDKRYDEALDVIQKLHEHNAKQAEEIERLHKRMDEQNTNISMILREILETKKLVAAAANSRKRKWWNFWNK